MHRDRASFVDRYGGVYEKSPWVAEKAFDAGCDAAADDLAARFAACVDSASREQKLALIQAHPDLAGKAAIGGELTDESACEQKSARLDQCTPAQFRQFRSLNRRYREKFGFPFIMAVRDCSREEILAAFENRLGNDADSEFEKALGEIHKIAAMRLEAL